MKLLKKIVPLATVATVTAGIVPMVTSCKNNGGWIDATKHYDTKDFDYYKDSILQYKDDGTFDYQATYKAATNQYVAAINANPSIVYDDFKFSMNQWYSLLTMLKPYTDARWSELLLGLLKSEQQKIPEWAIYALVALLHNSPLKEVQVNKLKGKLANFELEPSTDNYLASYDQSIDLDLTFDVGLDYLPQTLLDIVDELIGVVPTFTLDIQGRVDCDLNKIPFAIWADPLLRAKEQMFYIISHDSYGRDYHGFSFIPNIENKSYLGTNTEWSVKVDVDLDVVLKSNDLTITLFGGNKQTFEINSEVYNVIFGTPGRRKITVSAAVVLEALAGWSTYYYSGQTYDGGYGPLPVVGVEE